MLEILSSFCVTKIIMEKIVVDLFFNLITLKQRQNKEVYKLELYSEQKRSFLGLKNRFK